MTVLIGIRRPKIQGAQFPVSPGVYAVYDSLDTTRPLYVGVAATQTIRERWKGQHLKSRSGGSALRRTLGVYLSLVDRKLSRPDRYYPPEVEEAITSFLEGCYIEFFTTDSATQARALETELIEELDPLLNVLR